MKSANRKVDLSGWGFDSVNNLTKSLGDAVVAVAEEALQMALESDDTRISLPAVWGPESDGRGGPCPDDPLTIYVQIALGPEWEGPEFRKSLTEMVRKELANREDDSYDEGLSKIRDALRALADEIDEVIKP